MRTISMCRWTTSSLAAMRRRASCIKQSLRWKTTRNSQSLWRCALIRNRPLVNIFINAIYLYDGYFTMILNAGNRPLSIENIPLDDIEKTFENDDVGCLSNSQLVADAPPRQNNTMRSSAAASGVRSTDGVVFPFQIEPAAPGLISGIFFAYKSWERADQL